MWRSHPQHLLAKRAIADGKIGKLRLIRGAFSFTLTDPANVRMDERLGGGCLLDVGAYPISASRFFFEAEPESVFGVGHIDKQTGIETSAQAIMRFACGEVIIDCAFDLPYRGELELVGDSGTIYMPRAWQPDDEAVIEINGQRHTLPKANQYVIQFEEFSRAVLENAPLRFEAEDAVRQIMVIETIKQSISSGRCEKVPGGKHDVAASTRL
jgi:xylose dehydrogenase (NAD/NADP)